MIDRHLAMGAIALVAIAALGPALAAGVPANQVPVQEADQAGSLAQPTGDAWEEVDPVTMALASAPSGVPDASDTSVRELSVQVAQTDDDLYIRLTWRDTTADETIDGTRSFVDAAAVQFPANASSHPGIAMGSSGTPVNVWYWSAHGGGEELLAGGPGTTTAYDSPALNTTATWEDGRWRVVFHRPLVDDGPNRVAFEGDTDVDVAFGVWNGSNMERSGRKAVSEWQHLQLGPPPQGPPYEAILWTVAGIAIVVVIVVTSLAVRRAE